MISWGRKVPLIIRRKDSFEETLPLKIRLILRRCRRLPLPSDPKKQRKEYDLSSQPCEKNHGNSVDLAEFWTVELLLQENAEYT